MCVADWSHQVKYGGRRAVGGGEKKKCGNQWQWLERGEIQARRRLRWIRKL
jgi:hypothetical protein